MCGGAVAQRTKYNSSDAVSGYTLHVAEEGKTLTRDQQRENWALGGADEPEYFKDTILGSGQRGYNIVGGLVKDSMRSNLRKTWYDNRKAEWNKYYANIGKDYEPSLDIPDRSSKEQKFYGSDGSTWKD